MDKLYALSLPLDHAKRALYVKGTSPYAVEKGSVLDFITYFNSFCVKKWLRYTTLTKLELRLELRGRFRITFKTVGAGGEREVFSDVAEAPGYLRVFDHKTLSALDSLLGFELTCLEDGCEFSGGAWYGDFTDSRQLNIGISICTFKREEYIKRTLKTLEQFMPQAPWLRVLVVDNGGTLPLRDDGRVRILHNRNYGGSGGFARGLIEYAEQEASPDYVLLMDDDIVLDTTAIERTHSFLCGLKSQYADSFLAGAMLSNEKPTVQFENTAFWNGVTYRSNFHDWDLTDPVKLAQNGELPAQKNQYAGWWYCCIPSERIRQIGYPLPLFIKNDDMEYSVRNDREIITLNGVGVWHQVFDAKQSPVMSYYANRNSLILQHYTGGGRFTLLLSLMLKAAKRLLRCDWAELHVLARSAADYILGLEKLTELPADRFMQKIAESVRRPFSAADLLTLIKCALRIFFGFKGLDRGYKTFRRIRLSDVSFWKDYFVR